MQGGAYGGGGSVNGLTAGGGVVRILWGTGRSFPSTNVDAGSEAGNSGKNGGVGLASSITGVSTSYAGGGGGGTVSAAAGTGGTGGGGAGSQGTSNSPVAGSLGTGGGGGGAGANSSFVGQSAGNGGAGVVIIRYPDSYAVAVAVTGTPAYSLLGGYRIYRFNSSGSLTF
jgi:hypothetical protein